MSTVLERFAEISAADVTLSAKQTDTLGLHLLDTLAAWFAGSETSEGKMLARFAAAAGVDGGPLDRLAQRVATVRLTETDDLHMFSCTTPGAVVVPVALTLAAAFGKPRAGVFLHALDAGYEAAARLGVAVTGPAILSRGIWPTYLVAPFAAAAATARLIGLDRDKTADALAMALAMSSGAPGAHTSTGSPRWLLVGQAARAGALSAYAAAQGYSGDLTLLDGDWFARGHGIECDGGALVAPGRHAIDSMSLKRYCAAKQTIAAIEAFQQLLDGGVSPADIVAVRVVVPAAYRAMIGSRAVPTTRQKRIASVAYNLAVAAFSPDDLFDVGRPDRCPEPGIAEFMARVEVAEGEDLTPLYPRHWPARVTAVLAGGQERAASVIDARGDPLRPLDSAAVAHKFHRLADPALGSERADTMIASCLAAIDHDEALADLCAAIRR